MNNIKKYFVDNYDATKKDLKEIKDNIESSDYRDFTIELESSGEFRLIQEDAIDDVFYNSVCDLVDDCYLSNKDDIVKRYFDYQQFVRDCEMDWFWSHFSWYDWSEEYFDGYYIFRTN